MNATTNALSGVAAKQSSKSATSRALSPVRCLSPNSPRMPSPRSSPILRPSSPLTPTSFGHPTGVQLGGMHFNDQQPASPRLMHARAGNSQRRASHSTLQLPALPRFHPANYPSGGSTMRSTSDSHSSLQVPTSPGAHRRVLSDAQRHLYAHQRGVVSAARASSPHQYDRPSRVRLAPLGSPGPVTPLELEGAEGYFFAHAQRDGDDAVTSSGELVDRLVTEEARQRQRSSDSTARTQDR